MKKILAFVMAASIGFAGLSLTGCPKSKGPLESARQSVQKVADDAKKAVNKVDTDDIQKAVKNAGEAAESAIKSIKK